MDKQIITFSANEQNLVRIGGEYHYSSNKVSYIGAHFDLGANWDGFDSVRAVWFTDRINGISTVLDGEGNCTVPTEVLKKKDRVFVNLVGSIVSNGELTDRLTTYPAVALVVDSKAKVDSTETAPVTPSQFEQFVSIVQDAVANIKDIVSTTLNADYTLTFVYSDGTSYTTPSIRGERGPQGAGGADGTDGNGIASAVLNSNYTLTLTFTDGTSYTTPSIRGAQGPKGDPGDVSQAQLDAAVSDLKSEITEIGDAVFGEKSYPTMTAMPNRLISSSGSLQNAGSDYKCFTFPTEVGKHYTIEASNNEVLRVGFSNFVSDEARALNGVHTSTDKTQYGFTAEYSYCYVFGTTTGYAGATFIAYTIDVVSGLQSRTSALELNLDTLDKKLYTHETTNPITLTEHQGFTLNSSGYVASGSSSYSVYSFPCVYGTTYKITATNNEVLRVAFASKDVEASMYTSAPVTSENLGSITIKCEIGTATHCFVFGKTSGSSSATFAATTSTEVVGDVDALKSSTDIVSDLLGVKAEAYTTIDDCHTIGTLHKNGVYIVDENEVPIELRGVGLHHILQYSNLHTWESFNALKNMGVNLIRCSVYLHDRTYASSNSEPTYGYISHPSETKAEIERIVKNCIDLGLYVILDWHNLDDHINDYKTEAIDFFDYYSAKYADVPNVIYEFANEPYSDDSATIASYVKDVRDAVLANASDPIMIVGQPAPLENGGSLNWDVYDRCSALYSALSSLGITDVFISPHIYAGNIATELAECISDGIPVFVSEWGNSDSDGDGSYHDAQALIQINYCHQEAIGQCIWKYTDQTMKSSLLKNYGWIDSARYSRGFIADELSHNGELLLGKYKEYVTTDWIERTAIE